MQLLELTTEEAAFLRTPARSGGFEKTLAARLAAVLGARLRLPVRLVARQAAAELQAPALPVWRPDDALATWWLTRRLGGRRVAGTSPFLAQGLVRTLDQTLAECWLGNSGLVPPALAWTVTSAFGNATLTVELPEAIPAMTRWAREVIGHG